MKIGRAVCRLHQGPQTIDGGGGMGPAAHEKGESPIWAGGRREIITNKTKTKFARIVMIMMIAVDITEVKLSQIMLIVGPESWQIAGCTEPSVRGHMAG